MSAFGYHSIPVTDLDDEKHVFAEELKSPPTAESLRSDTESDAVASDVTAERVARMSAYCRRHFVLVLLLVVLATTSLCGTHLDAIQSFSSSRRADSSPSGRFAKLYNGRWLQSQLPYTQQDCLREFGTNATDYATPNRGEEFALSVASWRWTPDLPDGMREWDGFELTKRLINSRVGLLLVGDSLSQQTMSVLGGMANLTVPNLTREDIDPSGMLRVLKEGFYIDPGTGKSPFKHVSDGERPSTLIEIRLDPDSTWYARLLEELPHVPEERLRQPFVRSARHDSLVDKDRITELAQGMLRQPTFQPENQTRHLRHHDWKRYLAPLSREPDWPGEQNAVLLFNGGAHWSINEFGIDGQELSDVIELMAHDLISELIKMPRLDLIFRSTAPGQPYCPQHISPVYPAPSFPAHPQHPDWGWDQFEPHNQIWAAEMNALAPSGRTLDGSGAVVYMNISEMAGQRPDARGVGDMSRPDCLHWTRPGVPSYWVKMMWHILGDVDKDAAH